MDNNDNGQAPATDDQELAQVLAGMNQQAATDQPTDQPVADQPTADQSVDGGLQFEETGTPPVPVTDTPLPEPPTEQPVPDFPPTPEILPEPTPQPVSEPAPEPSHQDSASSASPELDAIKKDALDQLRPLVDKLNLPAQEKFDTLLLIIRSTDDQSLLTAANEAAKLIEDETKRAEALLDVIKEIDFFSHPAQ